MLRARGTCSALLACVTGGCAERVLLPDVVIEGGSPAQREAAASELIAFDEAVGPGRVAVTGVVFEDLKDDYGGWYNGITHRVLIDAALEPYEVRAYIRHELCHALDRAEGLLDAPTAPFDVFGDDLFDPDEPVLDHHKNRRGRRSEALAQICEVGPFGAWALSRSCPGEPAIEADLAAWVTSNVWKQFPEPDPWPWPRALATSDFAPHGPWQEFGVIPTVEPSRVRLIIGYEDVIASRDVDLYTGDPAGGQPAEGAPNAEEPPVVGLPNGGEFSAALGWPTGPGAAVVELPVNGLPTGAARLIASDGEKWALVGDGCLDEDTGRWGLFTADDRVWYAWGDGLQVSWAPLGE